MSHSRSFEITVLAVLLATAWMLAGCRGRQFAHVLSDRHNDMVGSHEAGAETFNSLVENSVAQLLARQGGGAAAETGLPEPKRICFVGVENRSQEEIGDFKDQLYENIDASISSSGMFQTISPRYVETGLRQLRLLPDDLMNPARQAEFQSVMQRLDQPFDYLLFAKLTSGTTESNRSYQRDYTLTLELVNINDGSYDKESAKIRKGYHTSRLGKLSNYSLKR